MRWLSRIKGWKEHLGDELPRWYGVVESFAVEVRADFKECRKNHLDPGECIA